MESVEIWRGHEAHDWHRVFSRSTTDVKNLLDLLIETVAAHGFELELITLMGPGWITSHSQSPPVDDHISQTQQQIGYLCTQASSTLLT